MHNVTVPNYNNTVECESARDVLSDELLRHCSSWYAANILKYNIYTLLL